LHQSVLFDIASIAMHHLMAVAVPVHQLASYETALLPC
jgi:hypothetical protein